MWEPGPEWIVELFHLFHLSAREKRWEIAPAWPVSQDLPVWCKKHMPRDVTGNTQESDSRYCATSDRTVPCLMLRVASSSRSNLLVPSLDGGRAAKWR